MTHDFKNTLNSFEKSIVDSDIVTNFVWMRTHEDTIRLALKLADRLICDPSDSVRGSFYEAMRSHGYKTFDIAEIDEVKIFKAMRDQLLKEYAE